MGLSLDLLSGTLDEVLPVLNRWRGSLLGHLGFVLLDGKGVLRPGVAIPASPDSVLVSFDGKGAPGRWLPFTVRAATPVSIVQVPAKPGDRGLRLSATLACTADVWMVP